MNMREKDRGKAVGREKGEIDKESFKEKDRKTVEQDKKKGKEKVVDSLSRTTSVTTPGELSSAHRRRKPAKSERNDEKPTSTIRSAPVEENRINLKGLRSSFLFKKSALIVTSKPTKPTFEGCSSSKRVKWADKVGQALTQSAHIYSQKSAHISSPSVKLVQGVKKREDEGLEKSPGHRTYKEALLTPTATTAPRRPPLPQKFHNIPSSTPPDVNSFR